MFLRTAFTVLAGLLLASTGQAQSVQTDGSPSVEPKAQATPAPGADALRGPLAQSEEAAGPEVWGRIRRGFKMPTLDSPKVDSQLGSLTRHPQSFTRSAERAGLYLYHIVGQVESRGMPMELALLPFVESSFMPTAVSPAKASGLWQFIPSTGTTYSLEQNLWKDERRDVIESTRAALDYFQKLYDQFHDWHLALAAYNWGEGNVQKAIDRNAAAGLPTDYQHLRMPAETANYVPRLEAVKRIVQNPDRYGITLPDIGSEPYFVQVFRDKDIDIKTAARLADMKLEDFTMLNPGFNRPVIVGAHENAMLIPADNLDKFMENLARWRSNGRRVSSWKTHRMQPGESLLNIAENNGMTIEEIREVNRIPSNRRVAQNSLLLVRADSGEPRDEIEAGGAFFRLEPVPSVPKVRYRQIRYRVRKGDTLDDIADRMHITKRSIIVTNRLRQAKIHKGQSLTLTVPVINRSPDIERISAENAAYRESRRYRLNANPPKKSARRSAASGKVSKKASTPKKSAAGNAKRKSSAPAAKRPAQNKKKNKKAARRQG
ncbi:transglycosylase SLT domain-containing protein [Mesosutterella sp. OilRF-GAM-744-9]|uniref:Transglycosylase SLT domain-containing protein n=1 Tax=Mesosutterella porci TaxID=2915351 RepID=A0ABS9MSP3_9BURK|nr:transglycosylase SLT domain-containing protein [Mesosutterella sp. oilRF-744-WT-GAM-9]MCG5031648.1 transglycosylase SLT domain-containing protein [Mesosutterella sp. oilRF-744-WT-GAM-9]